ncbi:MULTISPECIES: MFS transporter [unclassified Micromonospora]|uniref:MFS transporter n=1 Tax=unclassified Micromonospora TaxID=2617518 RepID=UPI0018907C4E|nr:MULTISPECIES: MFS transporter [unclassified Micromonospora]MBF5031024.1 MFS transporter [Micromonospora sp. ANENR4]MCZ7474393.1 MFS transporter [Micromonospora sp. WMMC273]WBC05043.1 MFS transporter [Micromonospora sp. WMMA1976]
MGRVSPLPPPGPLRTLAYATLVNTVGAGLWLAGGALYLTRDVGLSATSVGAGLTVAGLVGLSASVPLGALADRWDPRTLRAVLQVGQAVAALAYLLVGSFPAFLAVAVPEALLAAGNLAVRAALVAAVGGPDGRVHAFATLRAVANLGITVGTALAGIALAVDTHRAYQVLVVGNAATYLLSAALLMRLPPQPAGAGTRRTPGTRRGGGRRRGGPLRDGRFLAVSGVSAVLSTHVTVLVLVVPLWTVDRAGAPPPVVSAVLLANTVLTVLLAVRLSRGAERAAPAARKLRRAGLVLAAATPLYAATAGLPVLPAVVLLLVATAVWTVGDLWHGAAGAGLAYDLAPPGAIGAYQGADGLLTGLAQALGRGLLTLLVLGGGPVGWLVLGGIFATAGLAAPALAGRAIANRRAPEPRPAGVPG